MRTRTAVAFVLALLSLVGFSTDALSWGHDGHRIVAAIAFKLLPPDKAAALDKLLRESDLKRGFVDASGYPDDVIRSHDRAHKFGRWHYVNWPDDQLDTAAQSCKKGCVITALPRQISVAKTSQDPNDKALALSWVIHLVGDLHQPLHVADRDGDEGGNKFPVTYRGKSECGPPSAPREIEDVELHKVWDDCLVFTLEAGKNIQQTADEIRGVLTTYKGHPAAKGTIQSWAKEGHILAHTHAYADLQHDDDVKDEYINDALPVVKDQLLKAGIRLAKVIDENF
jgi:hypothetical protein